MFYLLKKYIKHLFIHIFSYILIIRQNTKLCLVTFGATLFRTKFQIEQLNNSLPICYYVDPAVAKSFPYSSFIRKLTYTRICNGLCNLYLLNSAFNWVSTNGCCKHLYEKLHIVSCCFAFIFLVVSICYIYSSVVCIHSMCQYAFAQSGLTDEILVSYYWFV